MATFTTLRPEEVDAIAAEFGMGQVTECTAIAEGTINSNFSVVTDKGRYFVRVNEGKTEADVAYEAKLVTAVAGSGVSTPVPLAVSGDGYARVEGHLVSVFPWVEGTHQPRDAVTATHASAVGAALAQLHAAALTHSDLERAGIYTSDDIVRRFETFRGSDDPDLAPAIATLSDEFDWQKTVADRRADATTGIIHGDLFRDNVLFRDNTVAALLDFEQASSGSLAYDLAVCINAWCFTECFVPLLMAALVRGYEGVRPLTKGDRDALFVEARASAARSPGLS